MRKRPRITQLLPSQIRKAFGLGHYFDHETSQDLRAHIHEYAERGQEAAGKKNQGDWIFFFGARKAIQRLLHLQRGRREPLRIPIEHRHWHSDSHFTTCFACMGSGYHPQKNGGGVAHQRIDALAAGIKKDLKRIKDKPVCPLCGEAIDYSFYLGSEKIVPCCKGCGSRYGEEGFPSLERAVEFMRGPIDKKP